MGYASYLLRFYGRFPEWPKGADCKSVGNAFGGSNPPSPTIAIQKRTLITRAVIRVRFSVYGTLNLDKGQTVVTVLDTVDKGVD